MNPPSSMKTLILAAIRCSLIFLVPTVTYAISAQWDLDPTSGDWNTADNWTPNGVPNGPADTATFGLSHTTDVSISANTEVNGITFTSAATNSYNIFASPGTLTISGVGITNNSGTTQNFRTFDFSDQLGAIVFSHSATAGSNVFINNFFGSSTSFFDTSTAGNVSILNGTFGVTRFWDNSTAGSANIEGFDFTFTQFFGHSSAANATISVEARSNIEFNDFSTAGSATIKGFGVDIFFSDFSRGGTAAIGLFFSDPFSATNSALDISGHNAPGVTIGSLEGDETARVFLGANKLTIGSNNLSTTFSGIIQDGGLSGGTGGSLTKIGSGTLILSGANTYTGDTNVNRGVLQVEGSITSNAFVNHGGTLAGTGTINGNGVNNGRVSPGSAGAPGMLTVTGNYTQAQFASLMIQIAGVNAGEFSVLNVLGTANLSGHLDPVLLNGFVPTIGESFTFLNYGAVTGTLSIFNPNIDNLPEHWEISYFPTHAILAVVAGNVPVPDQGSTFLLLTLGLLGLVTYQQSVRRKQA